MRHLLLLLLLIFGGKLWSQTITVSDINTRKPVENVAVYNSGRTVTTLTDAAGQAGISSFYRADTIHFQHTSYEPFHTSYAELERSGFKVLLIRRNVALQEIIISATRFEREEKEIPNKVETITPDQISFTNPQTAADMLSYSDEVFVQKSQLGGGSPMIRGFSANSVLIVVDGVRMNNASFRSGNLQNVISIDPNSLERTEVIYGPGTVIYGSDALGGVMSFMTLDPKLSGEKKFKSSVNMMARYASANTERTGHLDITLSGRKLSSVTSFTASWFDDLRMGSSGPEEYLRRHYVETQGTEDIMLTNTDQAIQRFSGYNQFNIMQKLRYKPNTWLDLTYGFHYSESSDVPRYDRLIQYSSNDTLRYASWYYGPQVWIMNALSGSVNVNCRMITEMKFGLAWQRFRESRHSRSFNDPWFKNQEEQVDMYTVNIDIEKKLNESNSIFYGFEWMYNDIVSTADKTNFVNGQSKPTGTRYPDGSNNYNTMAGYINYEHKFSEHLFLFAGMRYSYVKLNSSIADTSQYHFPFDEIVINTGALNGSVGLSWKPSYSWQTRLNFSSGFRAPNLDDAGKVFDSSPGNVVVPNPGLKPEYAYNADIGVKKSFSNTGSLELSGFYTYLLDAMVRRDFTFNDEDSIIYDGTLSRVEAVVNAGSAWIYGLSVTGVLNMGEYFQMQSMLSWMRGEDDEGYSVRHVPPIFGRTSFIFRNGPYRVELYANYNGEIPYDRLTPTERDKPYMYATDGNGNPYSPGWWTLNIKSTIRIIEQLSMDVGLENIFSKRYRPYSSGIVSPGRNFIIAIRASL